MRDWFSFWSIKKREGDSRVGSLVNLLVQPLEAPPAVKVVPEVVESFDLLLGGIVVAKAGDRLGLGEARIEVEDVGEGLEEIKVLALYVGF